LPINRAHPLPLTVHYLDCFLLRASALKDSTFSLQGFYQGLASMDEDDPELSCSSPENYHCQVISMTKSVSLNTFYVRALMQRVQLLIEASAGTPSWFAMTFLAQLSLSFDIS